VFRRLIAPLLALAFACGVIAQAPPDPAEVFNEIDSLLKELEDITGFQTHHRVPAQIISRDKVKDFLEKRMKESVSPEEVRVESLTLKKFGLVPQDFDLAQNTVDLLTEQAAAFYDFHRKKLYITDWTPSANREPALVHELAHALADQNVHLEKFIREGRKSDDGSLARLAVMEGQASWLMAEYLARKSGQTLSSSPGMLDMMARSIESGAGQFPLFESEPLYIQRTLVFPYTKGMLFQNAVFEKMGQRGFSEVFRRPPVSSAQVLHPERYFSGVEPARPALPELDGAHGYKRIAEGSFGELDHAVLLEQSSGPDQSKELATHCRGGAYALLEHHSPERVVLLYAAEWDDAAAALRYFAMYRHAMQVKWKHFRMDAEDKSRFAGEGDDGYFAVTVAGTRVTSTEGAENPIGLR
jgi:hypothetical protein